MAYVISKVKTNKLKHWLSFFTYLLIVSVICLPKINLISIHFWSQYDIIICRNPKKVHTTLKVIWDVNSILSKLYKFLIICMNDAVMQWILLKAVKTANCFLSCVEKWICYSKYISMPFFQVSLFRWEIKVVRMQSSWRVSFMGPSDLLLVVPMNLLWKRCFLLPVKERVYVVCPNYSFWTFCF